MEAERSSRRSVNRKPLSDRTNLTPTTTPIRNLSSSLFVKPPNPKPKPYNSSTNKPDSNSHKSGTSVGSSNNNVPNPRIIPLLPQPSNPPRISSPNSSSANPGIENGEAFEPLVVYSRRQSVTKTKDKGKEVSVLSSCPHLGKTKDRGKLVAVPFSCPYVDKTKDKEKTVAVPLSSSRLERENDKGKAVAVPFSTSQLEREKNEGKVVAVPFSSSRLERENNKGKAVASSSQLEREKNEGKVVAVPFSTSRVEREKNKRKAVGVTFSWSPEEKTRHKRKAAIENTRNKGKEVSVPFSCRPLEKAKDSEKLVDVPFGFPSMEKTTNKGKVVAVPFTCPSLPRTRNIRDELNDARDVGQSKSCTAPPIHKKKRRCLTEERDVSRNAIPLDFIEQQRAYFKEIDEFELPEEEVTFDELD